LIFRFLTEARRDSGAGFACAIPRIERSGLMAANGLSNERAARLMVELRDGRTPKSCGVHMSNVKVYCQANPAYAAEALPLVVANMAAMEEQKLVRLVRIRQTSADNRRNAEKCSKGHIRTLESTFYVVSEGKLVRRCKACAKLSRERLMPTSEQMRQVVAAVHDGETLANAGIVRDTTLRNFLRQNPKLGSRLRKQSHANFIEKRRATKLSNSAAPALMNENGCDAYEAVRQATRHLYAEDRDDVMSLMFVAIGEGRLKLRDASARVGEFLREHRRRPRVFGDARHSLDNPLGDGSSMTWLDTKTDADRLWG
jgi:hypothetical protein